MKRFVEKYMPTIFVLLAVISFWTPMYRVINEYEFTGFDLIMGVDIGYGYVLEKNYAFILLLIVPILGISLLYLIRPIKWSMISSSVAGLVSVISLVALTNYQKHIMGQYMSLHFGFWAMLFFLVCWCIFSLFTVVKLMRNKCEEPEVSVLEKQKKTECEIKQKKTKKSNNKQKIETEEESKKQEPSPIQIIEEDDRTVSITNESNKQNMIIEILGDNISKVIKLEKFPCTIGGNKNEDNVYFAECNLSSGHMVFFFEEGMFQVVDNESKSGTKLNGRNIGKTFNLISAGDVLEAGDIKIVIKQVG